MKKLIFCIFILSLPFTLAAQKSKNPLPDRILQTAEKSVEYYYDIYRNIHSNPELSLCEEQTSKLLASEMGKLGLEVTENVGGYGVVGVLRNGDGPVIMLRADMDALPVKEDTGLSFASKKTVSSAEGSATPVMHACGHDMHSTVLLGTLSALVQLRKEWKGTILAVGEPAEEIGAGASALIADGLFSRFPCPDRAMGFHVAPDFPAGTVGYTSGPSMAGVRDIDITFYGKGTHGAMPHNGIDPIVMAATAVLEFQTIISRNVRADEPAVLTVGSFVGGNRPNVVPEEVKLLLTVRYFNEEVGELIEKRVREISNSCAQGFGMDKMPLIYVHGILPPAINDPDLTEKVVSSMAKVIGKENLIKSPIHMPAEDFSFYRTAIAKQKGSEEPAPTLLLWLGASKSETEISGPLHSPTFHPEFHKTFITGVAAMTAAVIGQ